MSYPFKALENALNELESEINKLISKEKVEAYCRQERDEAERLIIKYDAEKAYESIYHLHRYAGRKEAFEQLINWLQLQ